MIVIVYVPGFMQASVFFQAEDGIRDYKVTGVQTCALPICRQSEVGQHPDHRRASSAELSGRGQLRGQLQDCLSHEAVRRSEERRVGKEGRSGRCEYL